MKDTLKKTCEWVLHHQKLLDKTSFILTHDPVSSQAIVHQMLVKGKKTLVFDQLLADSTFKKTYLAYNPASHEELVIGITKQPVPIDHPEIRIIPQLIKLKLPCVAEIKEITYLPTGQKAIISKFYNGGSLAKRIEEKSLSDKEKAWITDKLTQAVATLHKHRIVHRDIKGSNILLRTNKKNQLNGLFITDFGESIFLDHPTSLSNIEHFHSPPLANEIMEKHRKPLEDWLQLKKEELKEAIDPEHQQKILEAVNPFLDEIKDITTSPLYDNWGLGLTLFCLWNDITPSDFPWAQDAAQLKCGEIARKKRQFARTLDGLTPKLRKLLKTLLLNG